MPVTEERVTSNRFHFAIPVASIAESKKFYCDFMGCQAGNAEEGKWQDINFWDNELTLHQAHDVLPRESHDVDMGKVCVPHFGVHLSREDFDALKAKIEASSKYDYYDKPYLRFKGDDREQETFFIADPSGNILEIKTMFNPQSLWRISE